MRRYLGRYLGRHLGFAAAIAVIALGTVIWARSGAVVTTDGIAQSRSVGISPYEMMSNAKDLPVQEIADYY